MLLTGRNQKLIEEIRVQQEAEYESERANHQKLIKDYARLQQRFENLTSELQMSPALRGHRRSPSEISTISLESAVGETASSEVSNSEALFYVSETYLTIDAETLVCVSKTYLSIDTETLVCVSGICLTTDTGLCQ